MADKMDILAKGDVAVRRIKNLLRSTRLSHAVCVRSWLPAWAQAEATKVVQSRCFIVGRAVLYFAGADIL